MLKGRCSIGPINSPTDPPDSLLEYARLVVDALETAQVDYLLGGSLALAAWGEPRATVDIDLVINLPVEQMMRFAEELAQRDILVPMDLMLDLFLQAEGDVALVAYHTRAGFKAELFMLREGDELRASSLARRRLVELGEPLGTLYLHSPEDLILYKLKYYQVSSQTKHIRDIVGILLARGTKLDFDYLTRWIEQLHLGRIWQVMLNEARRLGGTLP
jgi:hypothetical protein